MKRMVYRLLAGATLASLAPLALASATSAGGFGIVTITLVDLDPADGVAPSIVFAADPGGFSGATVSGEVRSRGADGEGYREFKRIGLTRGAVVSASGGADLVSVGGSVAGQAGVGFSGITTNGTAGNSADTWTSYYLTATTPWAAFTLSANTAVQFSVAGWAEATTTTGGNPDTGFDEAAGSVLYLGAAGAGAGGDLVWDEAERAASASYMLDDAGNVRGTHDAWNGSMTVSYSNLTGAAAEGGFGAQVKTFGHSAVSPVPEPATNLMLLAGLAMLGAVARRRP